MKFVDIFHFADHPENIPDHIWEMASPMTGNIFAKLQGKTSQLIAPRKNTMTASPNAIEAHGRERSPVGL